MGELFVNDEAVPELTSVMPEPSQPVSDIKEKSETPGSHSGVWKIYGITLGFAAVVVVIAGLILNRRRKGFDDNPSIGSQRNLPSQIQLRPQRGCDTDRHRIPGRIDRASADA